MDRVERRLTGCSAFLSFSGRLQMINSVLTPTVTYAMCSLKLPVAVIENIDRARKQCLWRGNVATKKGGNLAAWSMVQMPKGKGGLGVLNLRLHNDALLLKQLHKFYSHQNVPWVHLIWHRYYTNKVPHVATPVGSFWWKDILKLSVLYRAIALCTVGDGASVSFWDDLWAGEVLSSKFSCLYSFAANTGISVKQIMLSEDLDSIFNLPLSQVAHDQLLDLHPFIQYVSYDPERKDVWTFIWGNATYSSRKYYKMVFQNYHPSPIFKKIWKLKCTPRLKFFAWLLFVDRLNTRNMLVRGHFHVQPNSFCVLCTTNTHEDLDHLFFNCPFADACWQRLDFQWASIQNISERVLNLMVTTGIPFFMEIFIFAAWELWKLRNSKIFDQGRPTVSLWFRNFKSQVLLQLVRVREDQRPCIIQWLESL